MKPYPVEHESDGVILKVYTAELNLPPHKVAGLRIFCTLHDSGGSVESAHVNFFSEAPLDTVSVRTSLLNDNVTLDGPSINYTHLTIQSLGNIGESGTVNLQLLDNNNNNTYDIPGSFHNLTHIFPPGLSSFHAKLGYSAPLIGTYEFPLDHYPVNFTIKIPLEDVKILNPAFEFGRLYDFSLRPTNMKFSLSDPQTGGTFANFHFDLVRTEFSYWEIIFPMLFIFFLLGTTYFLEPKGDSLVARISITIGVFAFVFVYDPILSHQKPPGVTTTFADILLKLVLYAAIASTIGSVIGYRIAKIERRSKTLNIIQEYNLYDILPVAVVLILSIATKYYYYFESQTQVTILIIVVGLVWGLLSQLIARLII